MNGMVRGIRMGSGRAIGAMIGLGVGALAGWAKYRGKEAICVKVEENGASFDFLLISEPNEIEAISRCLPSGKQDRAPRDAAAVGSKS